VSYHDAREPLRTAALRALSTACPTFAVYKHVDDALGGRGDADTFIASAELALAREVLQQVARDLRVCLIERRYRPSAASFYLCTQSDEPAIVEIDVNTAPRRMALTWLSQVPDGETELRNGVRVVRRPVEAVASYLYYHTRLPTSALPERERIVVKEMTADELERAVAVIKANLPGRTGNAVVAGLRLQHSRLRSDSTRSRMLVDRVLPWRLLIAGIVRQPREAIASVRWRFGRAARARRSFSDAFVRSGKREVESLDAWEGFLEACKRAGGVVLVG
jgi:hypothetical protein